MIHRNKFNFYSTCLFTALALSLFSSACKKDSTPAPTPDPCLTDSLAQTGTEQAGIDNTTDYNNGVTAAGKLSESDGLADGKTDAYSNGYTAGYNQVYNTYFTSGKAKGIDAANHQNYGSCASNGQSTGANDGYNDAYYDGNTKGGNAGYHDGYSDGYYKGGIDASYSSQCSAPTSSGSGGSSGSGSGGSSGSGSSGSTGGSTGGSGGSSGSGSDGSSGSGGDGSSGESGHSVVKKVYDVGSGGAAKIDTTKVKFVFQTFTNDCENKAYKAKRDAQGNYNAGFIAGEKVNPDYQKGYAAGLIDKPSYNNGNAAGTSDGAAKGYSDGYTKGYNDQSTTLCNNVYSSYYSPAYNTAYNNEYYGAYNYAYNNQYDSGYSIGEGDGYSDNCYGLSGFSVSPGGNGALKIFTVKTKKSTYAFRGSDKYTSGAFGSTTLELKVDGTNETVKVTSQAHGTKAIAQVLKRATMPNDQANRLTQGYKKWEEKVNQLDPKKYDWMHLNAAASYIIKPTMPNPQQ